MKSYRYVEILELFYKLVLDVIFVVVIFILLWEVLLVLCISL